MGGVVNTSDFIGRRGSVPRFAVEATALFPVLVLIGCYLPFDESRGFPVWLVIVCCFALVYATVCSLREMRRVFGEGGEAMIVLGLMMFVTVAVFSPFLWLCWLFRRRP